MSGIPKVQATFGIPSWFLVLVAWSATSVAWSQPTSLSGTYDGTPDLGFPLTLTLDVEGSVVQGRLVGDGIDFTLSGSLGDVQDSLVRASGTATNAQSGATVGFDLDFVPSTGALTLALFEVDAAGRPVADGVIVTTFTARTAIPPASQPTQVNPLAPPTNPLAPVAPTSSPWLGTFSDGDVVLVVTSATSAGAEGTVTVATTSYPFQVSFDALGVATGVFYVSGASFGLTLTLQDDVVTLATDGASYTLRRVSAPLIESGSAAMTPTPTPGGAREGDRGTVLLSLTSGLDGTDESFETGESYELHVVDLQVGIPVSIRLSSSEFDVYLLVVDERAATVFEEDDSVGSGTDVDATFVPSSTGQFGIVVTSAYPKEAGSYTLVVTVGGSAGDRGGEPVDARGVVATAGRSTLTYDAVDALFESLEFALRQVGVAYTFSDAEREQGYAWFAQNFASLAPQEQALYADARTVWTNVQANWTSASETDRYQFVIGVLSLYYGEAQVRTWLGLPAAGAGGPGGSGAGGGAFEDWAAANGLDPYDANTSAAQSCWAAAGCSSYDSDSGFVYEDPSY